MCEVSEVKAQKLCCIFHYYTVHKLERLFTFQNAED